MHARGMAAGGTCMAGETATAVDSTNPTGMHSYYQLPMKLREGNVFICVCLFTGRRAITHDASLYRPRSDLDTPASPPPC